MIIKDRGDAWMTRELIDLIHDKENARKRAKKANNVEDWNRVKELRNYTRKTLRKAKSDFIKEKLNDNEGDAKQFWDCIDYYQKEIQK